MGRENFGNNLRDDILDYKIDNEVASGLKIVQSEDRTSIEIELLNKRGKSIPGSAKQYIVVDPAGNRVVEAIDIVDVEDPETHVTRKALRITFKGSIDGTPEGKYIYCYDINELYTKLAELEENLSTVSSVANSAQSTANQALSDASTAQGAANNAAEMAEAANSLAETKSIVTASLEGTSVRPIKYITINNVEYKISGGGGEGDATREWVIENFEPIFQHFTKDNESLDTMLTQGVYEVTNALDAPTENVNGTLNVKTFEGYSEQVWMTNKEICKRVNGEVSTPHFYVNGEEVDQGEVELVAGQTYELSGDLFGNVVVRGNDTHLTRLILKGVNIQSDKLTAISFENVLDTSVVELFADSENYLKVDTNETPVGDTEPGTLHSDDNLTICGCGYLSIENNKCHAIRGSKLKINGEPHITIIDSAHDGIHAGKELDITGGNFKIINVAVDAISHSGGSNADGNMLICGGKFIIDACGENAFESKTTTGYAKIMGNVNISLGENVSHTLSANIKLYETPVINREITRSVLANEYGNPLVKLIKLNDTEEVIEPVDDVYTLTQNKDVGTYHIFGNLSDKIIKITVRQAKINLNGVYYNNLNAAESFIQYTPTGKNVKINIAENSVNFIKSNLSCIDCAKNLHIIGSGALLVNSTTAPAIYAPSGDLVIKNDGVTYIYDSQIGCEVNLLVLGAEPGEPSTVHGLIQFNNNTLDAYLPTKLSSDEPPQIVPGECQVNQYLDGGVVINSIIDHGTNPNGQTDIDGSCYAIFDSTTYENKPALVIKTTEIADLENVQRITKDKEYADSDIPDIEVDPSGLGNWVVYKGVDAYNKEESDEKYEPKIPANTYVLKSDYDRVVAQNKKFEDILAHQLYPTYPYITYTATGLNPIVVKGNKGLITDPILTDGSHTVSYDKDGNGYTAGTGVKESANNAQVNIIVTCHAGYHAIASGSPNNYKNVKYNEVYNEELNQYRIQCTQVIGDFTLTITEEANEVSE